MRKSPLKLATITLLSLAFVSGNAFAGPGKDCNYKKKANMKTEASTVQPSNVQLSSVQPITEQSASVWSAKADNTAQTMAAKTPTNTVSVDRKKFHTFDEALDACLAKDGVDLQACIDNKTGQTQAKPQS